MKVVPVSGSVARSYEFDDSADAVVLAISGSHCGHTIKVWTAKSNYGDYSVSAACSCGSTWEHASGGCPSHPPQGPEGDEELGQVVREAISLPDYLWPKVDPPEWWVDWLRRVSGIYADYPWLLLSVVFSVTAEVVDVLDGLLDKRLSFREARKLREELRHAEIWRPE